MMPESLPRRFWPEDEWPATHGARRAMPGGNGFTPVPGKPRGNVKRNSAGKARRRMPMARWFVDRLP